MVASQSSQHPPFTTSAPSSRRGFSLPPPRPDPLRAAHPVDAYQPAPPSLAAPRSTRRLPSPCAIPQKVAQGVVPARPAPTNAATTKTIFNFQFLICTKE
jgi:hypothetical protein